MSVSESQMKILYVMEALLQKTDDEHILSANDLVEILREKGYSAERKSIYNYIDTLEEFGIDIITIKGGKDAGYYIASRDFELAEVKLLVDAVQASKFITERKSKDLISKIEKLVSEHQVAQLNRDVYIMNRLKALNEGIYYNIDSIYSAILNMNKIKFQYTKWNMKKELEVKKNGEYYDVTPWILTWEHENYYLIGYDNLLEEIKHYRVDKMKNVSVVDEKCCIKDKFEGFNLPEFLKKTFNMYGGEEEKVTLRCDESYIGIILDRFGTNIMPIPINDNVFEVSVNVTITPQFFGWVTSLADGIQIVSPKSVVEEYKGIIEKIYNNF